MRSGAELIAAERKRQIHEEGYNSTHDACEHDAGEMAACGAAYALNASCVLYPHNGLPLDQPPIFWMFPADAWKPKTPLRDLVRAGALIAAEIDRLQASGVIYE